MLVNGARGDVVQDDGHGQRRSPELPGDVAHRLDRSGASRMVAAARGEGYLDQRPGRGDARRTALTLTTAGRALLDGSHRWQRATFLELTASWSPDDRARFAGYLERLARDVGA